MLRPMWISLALLVGCGGGPAPAPAAPATTVGSAPAAATPEPAGTVHLATTDGVDLVATYVPGPAGAGCVVLLHQLSSTRAEWAPVIAALGGRYHTLALDMRGHGESTHGPGGAMLDWHTFGTPEWDAVEQDLEAARAFMADKGSALDHCVYVGSSIGSTAVLRFAGHHPDVAGIVLLSPGLAYRGLPTVPSAKLYGNPKLLVYSHEAGPADAAAVLTEAWQKSTTLAQPQRVEQHQAQGSGHGMKIAADDATMVPAIAAFVDSVLAAPAH